MPERADAVIIGGGPVGCALALALRRGGRAVVVLERRPRPGEDAGFRPIALSYASRIVLERLGVWPDLAPSPIARIHVSQAQGPGRTELVADDAGVPALGYVVEYGALVGALLRRAEANGVDLRTGMQVSSLVAAPEEIVIACEGRGAHMELAARCAVHADGATADADEKSYGTHAVTARVEARPRAGDTAFERFTAEGPLALLPLAGAYGLVWSMQPERAAHLAACAPQEFIESLARAAGARPGRFVSVGACAVHPLALRTHPSRVGPRQVYIGNAAQTLHPVAGQGLNLGLRDAWDLAGAWHEVSDPGNAQVLHRYAAARRLDVTATVRVTDFLARAFTGTHPGPAALRGAALTALDVLPCARRFFARRMIFGASALP